MKSLEFASAHSRQLRIMRLTQVLHPSMSRFWHKKDLWKLVSLNLFL